MDSPPSHDDEGGRDKEFEDALQDAGYKLFRKKTPTDELMIFLEEAESLLAKVHQMPPQHTADSLYVIMRALMKDKILKHTDLDVQIAVASCFNEIARISAPSFPYPDREMKEFLKLVNIALKQLSCQSGHNFCRALDILRTMAQVRSCLMMIDIDSALVVEMFQILFNVISSDHDSNVFTYMEMIMTMTIEESDEISFELLSALLDSVRKEYKDTSPISYELGKKVFENCKTMLRPCVKEALKTKNLNLDDYDEIVTSLCKDTSKGRKRVENGATVLETEENDAPQSNDENGKTDTGVQRSKRRIKPSCRIRSDEIYEHPWMNKDRNSGEGSSDDNNEDKKTKSVINQHNDTEGKEIKQEIISKKDKSKDKINKMVDPSISKPAKDKDSKNEKGKKTRRPYGEKLVNRRIQVWWPEDTTFYTGTVTAYDAESKKHTVFYDDEQIEILNLKKETWEFIDANQIPITKPVVDQDMDRPSTAKEPLKNQEKTAKRKAGSSKKRDATSSSKRLKNEITKSGKSSATEVVYLDDELNNEMHETNVPKKDDEDNLTVKNESENR